MPPCIGHMELFTWIQRADFSEHIRRFKPHQNPLNSSHLDAPNTKSAPTGYRRASNIISQHYKQELSANSPIIPKGSTNQVSIKLPIKAISSPEQTQCYMCAKFVITLVIITPHLRLFTSDTCSLVSQLQLQWISKNENDLRQKNNYFKSGQHFNCVKKWTSYARKNIMCIRWKVAHSL